MRAVVDDPLGQRPLLRSSQSPRPIDMLGLERHPFSPVSRSTRALGISMIYGEGEEEEVVKIIPWELIPVSTRSTI